MFGIITFLRDFHRDLDKLRAQVQFWHRKGEFATNLTDFCSDIMPIDIIFKQMCHSLLRPSVRPSVRHFAARTYLERASYLASWLDTAMENTCEVAAAAAAAAATAASSFMHGIGRSDCLVKIFAQNDVILL